MDHGYEFCKSAIDNGNEVIVESFPKISEPVYDSEKFVNIVKKTLALGNGVKLKHIDEKLFMDLYHNLDIKDERAFYASYRFLILPKYYDEMPLLVLDIDSIINKKIEIKDDIELGLYLRENEDTGAANEYENMGMKVAAGSLYVTKNARIFVQSLHDELINNPIQWFCDQQALYKSYIKTKNSLKITDFNKDYTEQKFMDWDFVKPDSYVYTGKGDRKYNNKNYLAIKNKYKFHD